VGLLAVFVAEKQKFVVKITWFAVTCEKSYNFVEKLFL
jgi:hypothetical protein